MYLIKYFCCDKFNTCSNTVVDDKVHQNTTSNMKNNPKFELHSYTPEYFVFTKSFMMANRLIGSSEYPKILVV